MTCGYCYSPDHLLPECRRASYGNPTKAKEHGLCYKTHLICSQQLFEKEISLLFTNRPEFCPLPVTMLGFHFLVLTSCASAALHHLYVGETDGAWIHALELDDKARKVTEMGMIPAGSSSSLALDVRCRLPVHTR